MGHFFGALPPNKTSLAGGAVRRLSRQTLTRLPLRDGDRISKIWLYFGKFWIFLGKFFDTFFTLTFLPYHLMLANYKTLWNDHSWIPFSKSFHLICNILGCKRKSRPEKRKKHFYAAESYMIYVEMKKKITFFSITFLFVDRFQNFKVQKYLIFNSPWFCIYW